MKPETFFDNFEVLAEAPNAVQKLRELILQMAVRGKLVPQDEKDEPAIELLRRVRKKGIQNPNKKKIEVPQISSQQDGIPYNAPIGWEWVKLSEISERIHYGFTASADHSSIAVKLLRITDIQDNQVNWNTVPGCQIDDKEIPKYELHQNDILIARTGGTIGKTFLVEEIPPKAVFASYLIRVIPSPELLARYLKLFLESPFYWEQIRANSAGTGQPNVNGVALSNLIAPLPPHAEQRRIVAKVDHLMSLCDELESRQQRKRESRAHLNSAALDRLLAARAPGEFAQGWRRISDNFDLLYDSPENVGALRQAILQLAVMGKLVEQEPDDEPASVLLEQINKEKERIANEGRIKLIKTSPIKNDELAFELPNKWEWARLGNITIKLGAGSTPLGGKSVYEKTGIKFIRSQNVWNDGLRLGDIACISNDIHKQMAGTLVKPGDILLNITGASIGRSAIVPDDFDEGNVSQHVAIVRLADKKIRRYIHRYCPNLEYLMKN